VRLDKIGGMIFVEMRRVRRPARDNPLDAAQLTDSYTDTDEKKSADGGNRASGKGSGINRSVVRDHAHRDEDQTGERYECTRYPKKRKHLSLSPRRSSRDHKAGGDKKAFWPPSD
jgi:hypothetical protein